MNEQNNIPANDALNAQQESIIAISALTAVGDMEQLKKQLNTGLDVKLTVNEIKEILVQLYAYCGFPRSLNAISTFMGVVEERKAKGIADTFGKEASAETDSADKYERGRRTLETLTKTAQLKPAPGFGEFAPRIDAFLKQHLFADIFDSDVLSYQQRELVTIAALASMEGLAAQLLAHLKMGINTGLSKNQLNQAFSIIETHIGKQQSEIAKNTLLTMGI